MQPPTPLHLLDWDLLAGLCLLTLWQHIYLLRTRPRTSPLGASALPQDQASERGMAV